MKRLTKCWCVDFGKGALGAGRWAGDAAAVQTGNGSGLDLADSGGDCEKWLDCG